MSTPPPVPDVTRGDPQVHVTKARLLGWNVLITWGFLRVGLKDGSGPVFPWWRLTRRGAERKGAREARRLLARHRVDLPGKPRR